MSTLPQETANATDDLSQAAHRIRAVEVIGGFLDGARFDFSIGLNCFIGARGAGKTTVVELVRYALDSLPSREVQAAERRRIDALIERNLAGGRVQVTIETVDGLTYLVSRSSGDEPIVLTADGEPTEITLSAGGLFRADIYSQNEVESIADRTTSQLELLDNFEPESIADINGRIADLRTDLAAGANEILPLIARTANLGEEIATLASVDDKLQKLASDGGENAATINQAHALKAQRDRERRAIDEVKQLLEAIAKDLEARKSKIAQRSESIVDSELMKGPNGEVARDVFRLLSDCAKQLDGMLEQAATCLAGALGEVSTSSAKLSAAHKQQELAFRTLIEKHQQAQGQAAERTQLERRRNDLLAKKRQRDELLEQLSRLKEQRSEQLDLLSELLDERFAVRQGVAERINANLSPAIRVSVVQFGNPDRYRRLLEEGLKPGRLKHLVVAQKIANAFWPVELADVVRRRDASTLVDRGELNPEQADKVISALSSAELLYELETVELLDLPKIELKDGETYKDSTSLSTGQKCTAILPILLLDSKNPLIVDQPEDNLDNRFIFEAVVDSIRKVKQRRQLIFVTHNPNIPVLGDAERVFVLDSNGSAARKANEGTVDECKADIVTLLEGGEDAFKARKYRYAY